MSVWKKISITCGIIGLCCILAAGLFALYNLYDDSRALRDLGSETDAVKALVLSPEHAEERIAALTEEQFRRVTRTDDTDQTEQPPAPVDMPVMTIDGVDYVAIISIPALDLEFSVRNEWDKEGLKKSPCRYVGSVYTDDLIICAHNYRSHFGRLKELKPGDEILLVDMDGVLYTYTVALTEEIRGRDVESMVGSDYPLTLFTCTIGGKTRVTVRCNRTA